MYQVSLKNGSIVLKSEEAMRKVDWLSSNGELWSYISDLINKDIEGLSPSPDLEELRQVSIELLDAIKRGTVIQTAPTAKESVPSQSAVETAPLETVEVKVSGSALAALNRIRSMKK